MAQEALTIPRSANESGDLPALLDRPDGEPSAACLLAHGAGAPMDHPFLEHFATGLARAGVLVLRFDYAYMAQRRSGGKRRPPERAPALLAAHRDALASLRAAAGELPLILGGKSMGSRMSAMLVAGEQTEAVANVAGWFALGYPLHPAGKPDRLRDGFFERIGIPTLVVQGTRDALGSAERVRASLQRISGPARCIAIEDGDHSLEVRKSSGRSTPEALQEALEALVEWIAPLVDGAPGT